MDGYYWRGGLGYKRAEGLIDPVIKDKHIDAANTQPCKDITENSHSAIAKFSGEPRGNLGYTISSWFAAGRAAEILAQNGAAGMLTDNPSVKPGKLGGDISAEDSAMVIAFAAGAFSELDKIKETDPIAKDHVTAFHNFAAGLKLEPPTLPRYDFNATSRLLKKHA